MVGAAQRLSRAAAAVALATATAAATAQGLTVDGNCRDGQPHGAYEVRAAGGQVRVVGAFNRGKRMGSFLFWSSAGVRVAQLPFDEDVLSGTLAAWYSVPSDAREPRQKLEATYARGQPDGVTRSWYPSGRPRTELRYRDGALVEAHAYTEGGKPLPDAEARATAARDRGTDAQFIASLEAIVRANLPRCDPATDRLEKG